MSPGDERTVRADELLSRLRSAMLGEFEILGEAGRGGMAVVYLAHDIALDRKVAIKVISPNILWMGEGIAERFKREARVSASLSHPHIIPIYSVKEVDDLLFFIMKYVKGRTLEEVIAEVGPLPASMVHTILTQVGGALGYAHRNNVVHRDIKPANIMLDQEGWAVITDFGIAKVATGEGLTQTGSAVGTPAYMSPEQCSGLDVTGASDQYALAVVAYEMLSGRKPFEASSAMALMYKHVHAKPEPLTRRVSDCPPSMVEAIMRGLEKSPDNRWPQIEDMIAGLGSLPQAESQEVRTHMLELARSSSAQAIVERFRTPQSPVPMSRSRPPAEAPSEAHSPVPQGKDRAEADEKAESESTSTPVVSITLPEARTVAWAGMPVVAVALFVLWAPWRGGVTTDAPASPEPTETAAPAGPAGEAARLELEPAERVLEVGEAGGLRLSGFDDDGDPVELAGIVWTSSNTQVAQVSDDGTVSAVSPGTVEITATADGRTARAMITVPAPRSLSDSPARDPVAAVTVEPGSGTLAVGETIRLDATPLDARGSRLAGRPIAWSSSDPTVARVSSAGVVSAMTEGSVRITASSEGRSQAVTLTVVAPAPPAGPASLELSPERRTLRAGESTRVRASVRDSAGAPLAGATIRWSSSDEGVARVSPDGEVTAVSAGEARISASSGDAEASVELVVEARPDPSPDPVDPENAAAAVSELVRAYAGALEAGDLTEVRSLYPSMTPAQEEGWRNFFDAVRELTVMMAVEDVVVEGDRARAEVRMTLAYRSQRREEDTSMIRMTLGRDGGVWRILEIR